MHRSLLLLLPITLGLTACAGANASPPATAGLPATVPATEAATTPHASSTAPPTSQAVTTTTALPPTAPAEAPTTTIDLASEMVTAVGTYIAARSACTAEPEACDVSTFVAPGSEMEAAWLDRFRDRVETQLYAVRQPVSNVVVEKALKLSADSAVVTICDIDGDWVMRSNDTPDREDDAVVNDLLAATRRELTFVRNEHGWLPTSTTQILQLPGAHTCGA